MSRSSRVFDELWCKVFGHRLVDGPKYHNASTRGCSKICRRCGFYEVILDGEQPVNTLTTAAVKQSALPFKHG